MLGYARELSREALAISMKEQLKSAETSTAEPELVLEQRALRTRIDYRFFGDYVEYTIRDRTGALNSFSVKYGELPGKTEYGAYQPARRPVTGLQILLFAVAILLLSSAYPKAPEWETASLIGVCVAIFGGAVLLRWRFRNAYTTIPTPKGKLLVLRGKGHEQALQELESRRTRELRKLATVNPLNSPLAELRKFDWLKEQGIISAEEFEILRQKLAAASSGLNFPGLASKPPSDIVN